MFTRRSRSIAVLLGVSAPAPACVSVPDPPPGPADTAGLEQQYERPSATLTEPVARQIVAWAQASGAMQYATSLEFLRSAIVQANEALVEADGVTDTLKDAQGTLNARVGCPGHGATTLQQAAVPDAGADTGSVAVTFGVDDSNIQSGFVGRVEACRFSVVEPGGALVDLQVTLDFQAELGEDVPIGEELPASLLVLATEGTISVPGQGDVAVNDVNFRLAADGASEVLLDLATIGVPVTGTVVVVERADGTWAVRESRGTWSCGPGASACAAQF